MKSLTAVESKKWLESFGIEVLGDLDSNMNNLPLRFQGEADVQRQKIFCLIPAESGQAEAFAAQILEWLPPGRERLLLLTHWITLPDRGVPLFEFIRRGWGEHRSLSDAPGFVFGGGGSAYVGEEQEPPDIESVVLSGLVFLSLCYTWEGYIASVNCHDVIFLGDDFVQFSSTDAARIDEAKSIMEMFKLQPRTTSPWS